MATTDSQNYKFTSMPNFRITKDFGFGPQPKDIGYFQTNINGQDYYFIPQDYIQKGVTTSGDFGFNPSTNTFSWQAATYFSPGILKSDFQNELKDKGTYVDIANVQNPEGGTYGDYLNAIGRSSKGYFVPVTTTATKALETWQPTAPGPNGTSGIKGITSIPEGGLGSGLAYATTNTSGNDLAYTDSTGHSYVWNAPTQTAFQKFVSNLGPLPAIATAIFAPEFLPLVTGAQTAIQGGDFGDVLKSAGTSYALGQVGQQAGVLGDQAAAATQYGTDLGSAQTAALAAQEAGLGTATDVVGNIIGGTAAAVVSGKPIEEALTGSLVNQGINTAAGSLAAPSTEQPPEQPMDTSQFQNVYGGELPIEDVQAAFDTTGPLADTTAALDTAFLQDMDQGIQPQVPAENPFLAGMEETTATEGAGVAGAENPTGTTVTTPETTQEATKNLTPQQISQLLKLGLGLFGGGGAIAAAAKGLMGGSTGTTGTGATLPTIQPPTPFTGTYSGMNPYDAAYFQQVQQNYNRLFPTAPSEVANPLQSWYQTQYKPDTTISNKLFGV